LQFLTQTRHLKAVEFFILQHSGFFEKAFLSYNCFEVEGLKDSINIILSLFFLSIQSKIFVKKVNDHHRFTLQTLLLRWFPPKKIRCYLAVLISLLQDIKVKTDAPIFRRRLKMNKNAVARNRDKIYQ
jgi:hypothetical protein